METLSLLFVPPQSGGMEIKMESILKDLYYGKLHPGDMNGPILKDLKDYQRKMRDQEDQFISQLTDEQIKQFDIIMEERLLGVDLDFADTFVTGVHFGARIILEILLPEAFTENTTDS